MSLCTPPPETRPMRCSRLWRPAALAQACLSTRFSKKLPSSMARLMRVRSWYTTRPAPMLRWPTSELPIWPGGSPTAGPEASRTPCGYSASSRSKTGVRARLTALSGPGGATPQPSMTIRTTGRYVASPAPGWVTRAPRT